MTEEVIIYRITPYKEADAIISCFSKKRYLSFKATGILKSNAKLAGQIFNGSIVNIELIENKNKYILTGAKALIKLQKITNSYDKLMVLNLISEILSLYSETNNNLCLHYELIKNNIFELENSKKPFLTGYCFLAKALKIFGGGLNVKSCVRSGQKEELIAISYREGGLVTKSAINPGDVLLSESQIKLVKSAFSEPIYSGDKIDIKDEEVNSLLNDLLLYFSDLTSVKLKIVDFLF